MKLPRMSGLEIIRVLNKAGFKEARQKGSHIILTLDVIALAWGLITIDKGSAS